jgi:copper chaperone NosL
LEKMSRIMIGFAALMLVLLFFFPIWNISLSAPQYPEGIGLNIWINKITGVNKYDLRNINQLNHYIGMQEIKPDAIPELKIIPYIIILLILAGFAGALSGKRVFLILWLILFLISAVVGLGDFYKWEYDYGHNLSPDAPIKIPGMTYQPPLIGSKQLLNITASSYPGPAGMIAVLSLFMGAGVYFREKFKNHHRITE